MKKHLLLSAILVFGALATAFAGPNEDKMIEKIEKTNAAYAALQIDFTQTRTVASKATDLAGTMYFSAKDRLAMVYSKPATDRLIINGNMFHMNRGGKPQTFDTTKVPTMKTLSASVLCGITGRVSELAQTADMDYTIEETADFYVVKFTARKKAVTGYSKIVLSYSKKDCVVSKMEMEEFNKTVNVYTTKSHKVNPLISGETYNIPK